jgi:hypothetical protein
MFEGLESTTRIDVTLGPLMRWGSTWWGVVVVAAIVTAFAPGAGAAPGADRSDARGLSADAAAAFGRGRYGEAAQRYEAAFALRPDPGLLYNAAQSHRLAGNKARALELYRDYVRLYPAGANAEEAGGHVAVLQKAVDDERAKAAAAAAANAPPANTANPVVMDPEALLPPGDTAGPPSTSGPPPRAPRQNATVPLLSRPSPARADAKRSITQETWFWVVVGAAVAVVGVTAIVLGSRDETFPDASFGTARGN